MTARSLIAIAGWRSGLLLLVLLLAYLLLVHPWWTAPMLQTQDRIADLQQRELRQRMQLRQAPEVARRLQQVRARRSAPPGLPRRRHDGTGDREPGAAAGVGGRRRPAGQPQLRDHQPLAAGRRERRQGTLPQGHRAGAPALRHAGTGRGAARTGSGHAAPVRRQPQRARAALFLRAGAGRQPGRRAGRELRPVRLPASVAVDRVAARRHVATHRRCPMRVEGIAPRTWLLGTRRRLGAAACGCWRCWAWAAACSTCRRIRRWCRACRNWRRRRPSASGPLSQYTEISARPLFSEDRRPQPFSLTAEGDGERRAHVRLRADQRADHADVEDGDRAAVGGWRFDPDQARRGGRSAAGLALDRVESAQRGLRRPRRRAHAGPARLRRQRRRSRRPRCAGAGHETTDADATGAQPRRSRRRAPSHRRKPPAESTSTPSPATRRRHPRRHRPTTTAARIPKRRSKASASASKSAAAQLRQQNPEPPAPAKNP